MTQFQLSQHDFQTKLQFQRLNKKEKKKKKSNTKKKKKKIKFQKNKIKKQDVIINLELSSNE